MRINSASFIEEAMTLLRQYINQSHTLMPNEELDYDYEIEPIGVVWDKGNWGVRMSTTFPDSPDYMVVHDSAAGKFIIDACGTFQEVVMAIGSGLTGDESSEIDPEYMNIKAIWGDVPPEVSRTMNDDEVPPKE